jgi:hypothetical protein
VRTHKIKLRYYVKDFSTNFDVFWIVDRVDGVDGVDGVWELWELWEFGELVGG